MCIRPDWAYGTVCPCDWCVSERAARKRERKQRRVQVPVADGYRLTAVSTPIRHYDEAACKDVDKELFFPIGEGIRHSEQVKEAKRVCRVCPHRIECRDEARESGSHGIWGGETEQERIDAGFAVFGRPATRSTR